MKKTVVITSNSYLPNLGGVENSLKFLADSFVKQGYQVDIITGNFNDPYEHKVIKEVNGDIAIHRYPTCRADTFLQKLIRPFKASFIALKLHKEIAKTRQVEFTLSRFHTNTVLALMAGLNNVKYLVPGVVKQQNSTKNLRQNSGLQKLKSFISYNTHCLIQYWAFRKCKTTLVFSENMQRQVQDIYATVKKPILKPGVDTTKFKPIDNKKALRESLGIPSDKTVLLTVGRFVQAKGFQHVIDAMANLPSCHLVMVGDGEIFNDLKARVDKLGLSKQVSLFGSQSNTVPYYQVADIFLMSSLYEPLGQTILEALASGLPIVAYKGDGVVTATAEILSDNEAVFTEDISPKGLVNCINKIAGDDALSKELAESSREIAQSRFSWHTLAKNLIDIN